MWFSSVQSLGCIQHFVTPWAAARQASLYITNTQSLLRLMSMQLVMPSNHLILYCPPLLLLSIFPSNRVFTNELTLRIRWPKDWSFGFSISPSNEYLVLISLGLTGLISLQPKGLSRVFSSTTVEKHQFFGAQLSLWSNSHIHMTTGQTIALTQWTFVDKVMSLLFNMLSRLVTTFLPRSNCLLISWLQSPSTVILEPKKINHCCNQCFSSVSLKQKLLLFFLFQERIKFRSSVRKMIKRVALVRDRCSKHSLYNYVGQKCKERDREA